MSGVSSALAYCRQRSAAIHDGKGLFLGTASSIAPQLVLTCSHCIPEGLESIRIADQLLRLEQRFAEADLAILRGARLPNSYFVVASDEAVPNEPVLVYGYRLREGVANDFVYSTTISSVSERALVEGGRPHLLLGLEHTATLEPGMSGGIVLRTQTLEALAYVLGFDRLRSGERKQDLAVALSSAMTHNPDLGRRFTFAYQHRASILNKARRALAAGGFSIRAERLGDQPGHDEGLLCVRGAGVLQFKALIVAATASQSLAQSSLDALKQTAASRASELGFRSDRTLVLVDGEPVAGADSGIISVQTLVDSVTSPQATRATELIGGRFLSRSVLSSDGRALQLSRLLAESVQRGLRLVLVAGPRGSGKNTLLQKIASTFLAETSSGESVLPTILERQLAARSSVFSASLPEAQRGVLFVSDFDDLSMNGDVTRAIRSLKTLIGAPEYASMTVLVAFSGTGVQAAALVEHVLGSNSLQEQAEVCELLPLDASAIRGSLLSELGDLKGSAWWQLVVKSQEIFQIAQWPIGLAVVLDSAVQASWTGSVPSQVDVIAALTNGFLAGHSAKSPSRPISATHAFLVAVAKEMNVRQALELSLKEVCELYANVALADSGYVPPRVSAQDIVVPGLLSNSPAVSEVRFDDPVFLHYYLAVAIQQSLAAAEVSPNNPLFHRRVPVAILKDVIDLGVSEEQLWQMVLATREIAGYDAGYIGGNCASLLKLMGFNFSGRDLSRCKLRGAILADGDLRGADFSDSIVVDVGFANADLSNAVFTGADLARADLKAGCTVYQLARAGPAVFAATSFNRLVRLDFGNLDQPRSTGVDGFGDTVFSVACDLDGAMVAAGGQDGTVRAWDIETMEPRFILRGHFSDVRSIAFIRGAVVSGSVDGCVNVWSPMTARVIGSYRLCGGEIWSIATLDQNHIVALCDRHHLHIIDLARKTADVLSALPVGHCKKLTCDTSGKQILIGGEGAVHRLELTSQTVKSTPVKHDLVRTVYALSDGTFMIGGAFGAISNVGADWETCELLDSHGEYISDFVQLDEEHCVASSADGTFWRIDRVDGAWRVNRSFKLFSHRQPQVSGADFRTALNIPAERRSRLGDAGARV